MPTPIRVFFRAFTIGEQKSMIRNVTASLVRWLLLAIAVSTGSLPALAQSLSVTPSGYLTVSVGGTMQFAAVPTGFTISALKWEVGSVQGGSAATGIITTGLTGGLYTAPAVLPSQGSETILAVATSTTGSKYSASVNVYLMPPPPVITQVSPSPLPPEWPR